MTSEAIASFFSSETEGIFEVSKKVMIIRLRWPVVIICSYLLLFSGNGRPDPLVVYSLLFYVFSNTALYLVDEELFSSRYFYTPLLIFDTLFIAGTMALSGQISTEFYLAYFLTIILCSLCRDFRGLITVALLAPVVHGFLLFKSTEVYDPNLYLRLPLPFVVSLFYGYFAQLENFERGLKERAEQEANNMAMVRALSQSLTRSLVTPQILSTLREKIHQLVPGAELYVFLLGQEQGESRALLFDVGQEGVVAPTEVSVQDFPIVGECLARREPIVGRAVQFPRPARAEGGGGARLFFAGAMAIPIAFRDESYGAILLGFDETKIALGPREHEYGKIVAFATAIALSQSRREEQIQGHMRAVTALHEINVAVSSTLDLPAVLEMLLEKIEPLLPSRAVIAVRVINRETGALEAVGFRNITAEAWNKEIPEGGRGLSRAVLESREPVILENAPRDSRIRYPEFWRKHGLVSFLGLPLIAKGEVLGDISIFTKERHLFSREETKFFATLAGQAAVAIHNAQLFEDLKQQAVELERANSVKTEFLSVMSHELRTPLNVVMGYTGMIQDRMLGEITEEQEKVLGKVIKHSGDLLGMITSILDVAALEAQMIRLDREEVPVSELLDELRGAYDLPLNKDLTLIWDYPPELPTLKTDRSKLRHILRNLVNNAIKFTESGSVTVSAWYYPAARTIEIKVADTGVGIPSQAVPVIFERFRQMDSSETRAYGGVGLGLYIVKRFTELLGGQIEVESEVGKGSIFTLKLPYELL